jgi:phage terminase large subunit-like protein
LDLDRHYVGKLYDEIFVECTKRIDLSGAILPVGPIKPTTDWRSRLQVVAPYIKNGTVLFRSGCEQLLGKIFNLGVESHDDLCDGLTTLLQGLVEQGLELPRIHWIST